MENGANPAGTRSQISGISLFKDHLFGPTASQVGKQFSEMKTNSYTFNSRKTGDRYALLKTGCVVEIHNIVQLHNNNDVLICKTFTTTDNFFLYPCEFKASSNLQGVKTVTHFSRLSSLGHYL